MQVIKTCHSISSSHCCDRPTTSRFTNENWCLPVLFIATKQSVSVWQLITWANCKSHLIASHSTTTPLVIWCKLLCTNFLQSISLPYMVINTTVVGGNISSKFYGIVFMYLLVSAQLKRPVICQVDVKLCLLNDDVHQKFLRT